MSKKLIDTEEKSHKCNICDTLFKQKSNLNRHKMMHTGEKSFKCNICEKLFTWKSSLNNQ